MLWVVLCVYVQESKNKRDWWVEEKMMKKKGIPCNGYNK